MAIVVQSNYVITVATSPGTVALLAPAKAGNTIILATGWFDAGAGNVLPLPGDANGTYQNLLNVPLNSIGCGLALNYVPGCAAGTHSTTITGLTGPPDNNLFATAALYEVAGLTLSPFDVISPSAQTVNGGAGQTSQSTGSTGPLSQANEWAFGMCTFDDNPGVANEGVLVPAGFTPDPNIPASFQDTLNNIGLQIGWMEVTSPAALNPSFGWSSQPTMTSTIAALAMFKEPVSTPGILKRRGRQGGLTMGLNLPEWY